MSSNFKEQLAGLVEEMSDELEMAGYRAATQLPTESLRDWHERLAAILATLPEPGSSDPTEADNARLIASSPELLEALRDCRRALEIANFTQELAVVDAAIAKATGGAA